MGEQGTIEITAKFSVLAFMYAIVKAAVEVDGAVVARGWGTHRIEVQPGTHVVQVSYPWLPIARRAGRIDVTVEVAASETVQVVYTAPLLRYLPAKMKVSERFPSARVVKS